MVIHGCGWLYLHGYAYSYLVMGGYTWLYLVTGGFGYEWLCAQLPALDLSLVDEEPHCFCELFVNILPTIMNFL